MAIGASPVCMVCTRYKNTKTGFYCEAFPTGSGIPEPIIASRVDHRQAYEGDHGLRFDPISGEAAEYAEDLFSGADALKKSASAEDFNAAVREIGAAFQRQGRVREL